MKTRSLIIGLALIATTHLLQARTWTNSSGKAIEAELVELKGAAGSEVAVLKMANGQTYDVPLASLSDTDQAFAREAAAEMAKSPAAEPGKPSVFKDVLDGKLVAVDGRRVVKYEMAEEPQYYAFYFSASWCGPCREFTPKLISFYNENPNAKKTFEVIFVSRDNSENAMEDYMTGDNMPWPAVKYRNVERLDEVRKYAGNGIPCLVLVDREGKVVSDSYENGNYRGPSAVMRDMENLASKKIAAN